MDEYLFPLYLFGSLLLSLFAITLTVFLIMHRQRQTKNAIEKQRLKFEHQSELLNTRLEVQEQSMTLLSEELHDHIGQLLGLTKMYLLSFKQKLEAPEDLVMFKRTQDLLSKAINDVRHISHSLNSDLIRKEGLAQMLERDLDHIRDSAGLACSLEVDGTPYAFTPEQDLLIYRILQESLQNVLKHAEATQLTVTASYQPQELRIRIADNGKGFNTSETEKSKSLGLRNIKSRAALLKAQLNVTSRPGEGSDIVLVIPAATYEK